MPTYLPPRVGISQSAAFAEAAHFGVDEPVFFTLAFYHPSIVDPVTEQPVAIYVVNDFHPLTATLEEDAPLDGGQTVTFQPVPMEVQLASEGEQSRQGEVTITIGNVSRLLMPHLEAITQSRDFVTVICRIYLLSDLSAPHEIPPTRVVLRSATATATLVTAVAGFGDIANRKYPRTGASTVESPPPSPPPDDIGYEQWFVAYEPFDPIYFEWPRIFAPGSPRTWGTKRIWDWHTATYDYNYTKNSPMVGALGERDQYFVSGNQFSSSGVSVSDPSSFACSCSIAWNEANRTLIHVVGLDTDYNDDDPSTKCIRWYYSTDLGNTWTIGNTFVSDATDFGWPIYRQSSSINGLEFYYNEDRGFCLIYSKVGVIWKASLGSNGLPGDFTKIVDGGAWWSSADEFGYLNLSFFFHHKMDYSGLRIQFTGPAVTSYGVFYPALSNIKPPGRPNWKKDIAVGYFFDSGTVVVSQFNYTGVDDYVIQSSHRNNNIWTCKDRLVTILDRITMEGSWERFQENIWVYSDDGVNWIDFTPALKAALPGCTKVNTIHDYVSTATVAWDGINCWIAAIFYFGESTRRYGVLKSNGSNFNSWTEVVSYEISSSIPKLYVAASEYGRICISEGFSNCAISNDRGKHWKTTGPGISPDPENNPLAVPGWYPFAYGPDTEQWYADFMFIDNTLCAEMLTNIYWDVYGPTFVRYRGDWTTGFDRTVP